MRSLPHLFENNIRWAEGIKARDPDFFRRLARQQSPEYLWIGCSDSRVPANDIVGLAPGELFVHRNIANVVTHSDLNCLSVIQMAVDILHVKNIIVCGHYGCSGVRAALESPSSGVVDNWLRHIKDVYRLHQRDLQNMHGEERVDRLCELNVIEQVHNVCSTTIVQEAWRRGQELAVHGWIYSIRDGVLRDLDVCVEGCEQLPSIYRLSHQANR